MISNLRLALKREHGFLQLKFRASDALYVGMIVISVVGLTYEWLSNR